MTDPEGMVGSATIMQTQRLRFITQNPFVRKLTIYYGTVLPMFCMLTSLPLAGQIYAGETNPISIDEIVEEFREPNASLTVFSRQDNPDIVESERHGSGWRLFAGGDGTERRVILYSHCRCARVMDYLTFARGKKTGEAKDTALKADWFANRGVAFYAPLRKMTDTVDKRYGRAVESVEAFHHLTDWVSDRHGPNAELCYVGYAEGGAAVLYSSLFFKGRHVAMSPPSKASPFMLTDADFTESGKHFKRANNLTVLFGSEEILDKTQKPRFEAFQAVDGVNTQTVPGIKKGQMSFSTNLPVVGPQIMKACGFW